MKLFAFVRRARRPPTTSDHAPVPAGAQEDAAAAAGGAPSSEKRRRSGPAASWKPTLVAISEDAAVTAAVAQANKPAAAARNKANKTPARPSPPRAARTSYDDFRYSGPAAVLPAPAFTPTAFLF